MLAVNLNQTIGSKSRRTFGSKSYFLILGSSCLLFNCLAFFSAHAETNLLQEKLSQRIVIACQAWAKTHPTPPAGQWEDLELFILAEVLESLNRLAAANQLRLYLADYFPQSPLLPWLPEIPPETSSDADVSLEPDFSRLIRNIYFDILAQPAPVLTPRLNEISELLRLIVKNGLHAFAPVDYSTFLEAYSESPYAGWAAYQMIWQQRQQNPESSECLMQFGKDYPQHPLGAEALEAAELELFSPRRLSQMSSLLPGWGEEVLEPGLRESSGVLYYEALFVAGTIGLALAAQQNAREGNLTGALILANVLIFNHRSSAERAYVLAWQRNQAEQRSFIMSRLDKNILGTGKFDIPVYSPPAPEALANELVPSLSYSLQTVAQGFQAHGWLYDDQLHNLGFKVEYLRSVLDILSQEDFSLGLAAVPMARIFFNHAAAMANGPSEFKSGLSSQELALGMEVAWLTRLHWGDSWFQLRLSSGPAFRWRKLSNAAFGYQDQDWVLSGTLGLQWGGLSGSYWQIAISGDESFQEQNLVRLGKKINLPSLSLGVQFGLGIRF